MKIGVDNVATTFMVGVSSTHLQLFLAAEEVNLTFDRIVGEAQVQITGQSARAFADMESLVEAVQEISNEGDLVLVMGAGDVNQLWDRMQANADREGLATAA